jgi:hypothetical protein
VARWVTNGGALGGRVGGLTGEALGAHVELGNLGFNQLGTRRELEKQPAEAKL